MPNAFNNHSKLEFRKITSQNGTASAGAGMSALEVAGAMADIT